MFSSRFFISSVNLPSTVDFNVSSVDGFLYISGFGNVKSVELFDCFYKDVSIGGDDNIILSLNFFSSSLFKGVFIAASVVCRDFFWGFFFELYVYGPGFSMFKLWGKSPSLFEFSIGLNHAIYGFCGQVMITVESSVMAKAESESVLFLAMEKNVLYDVVACVILLKSMTPYKIMGIVYPRQLIVVKKAIKQVPA